MPTLTDKGRKREAFLRNLPIVELPWVDTKEMNNMTVTYNRKVKKGVERQAKDAKLATKACGDGKHFIVLGRPGKKAY